MPDQHIAAIAPDDLREINVNGVRYYAADDVEVWHRGLVASADRAGALEEALVAITRFSSYGAPWDAYVAVKKIAKEALDG